MQRRNNELECSRVRLRADDGQSLVEFAFALPFLCLIVLALVDFGRAVNYWLNSAHVASQGARIAAVWTRDCSSLATEIKSFSYSGGTVSITFPSGGTPAIGDPVRITVTHPYSYAPSGLIAGSWNITGSATMRLEQKPTYSGGCAA
jgi:hypothetical protein